MVAIKRHAAGGLGPEVPSSRPPAADSAINRVEFQKTAISHQPKPKTSWAFPDGLDGVPNAISKDPPNGFHLLKIAPRPTTQSIVQHYICTVIPTRYCFHWDRSARGFPRVNNPASAFHKQAMFRSLKARRQRQQFLQTCRLHRVAVYARDAVSVTVRAGRLRDGGMLLLAPEKPLAQHTIRHLCSGSWIFAITQIASSATCEPLDPATVL